MASWNPYDNGRESDAPTKQEILQIELAKYKQEQDERTRQFDWNKKEKDENDAEDIRQWNLAQEESRRRYDTGLGEDTRRWDWQKQMYEQDVAAKNAAGAASGASMSNLVNEYNRSYAEAKAANESRYQQMLGIADQTTGQQQADVRSAYAKQGAAGMQNLQRLGMANTTIAPTMKAGLQREESNSLNRLADTMQQTKLGIIGNREDEYPDLGLITSLATAIGQGGGYSGLSGMANALGGVNLGSGSGIATTQGGLNYSGATPGYFGTTIPTTTKVS